MIAPALALLILAMFQAPATSPAPSPAAPATPPTQAQTTPKTESSPEVDKAKSLSKVRRIFVETFGTDPISQQMQAMVISSLTETKRFTITEDKSKADAILRGTATEKTAHELHSYGSGTAVETAHGGFNSAGGGFGAAGAAVQDSSANTETIDSAHAAVRLVNSDGDVIWTTTQESSGAKFKGASADVADKIAKQLIRDAEKADHVIGDDSRPK